MIPCPWCSSDILDHSEGKLMKCLIRLSNNHQSSIISKSKTYSPSKSTTLTPIRGKVFSARKTKVDFFGCTTKSELLRFWIKKELKRARRGVGKFGHDPLKSLLKTNWKVRAQKRELIGRVKILERMEKLL